MHKAHQIGTLIDAETQAREQSAIDTAEFRRLMGQYVTGVCVVTIPATAEDDAARAQSSSASEPKSDGEPRHVPSGMTVNSFVSVSLDPMLIAWSIQNISTQFDPFTKANTFTVSILAEDQHALARRYASRGNAERNPEDFALSSNGLPVVAGCLGYMECRRWSLHPAGDHTMIFGQVIGLHNKGMDGPLGFYGGDFCRIVG